jgi:anthranilate/para-aminobenzoate synthase component I
MSEIEIATDLLTPLGAYLRLRENAGGSFLLESVERGRLGRYSFVGAGSRSCCAATRSSWTGRSPFSRAARGRADHSSARLRRTSICGGSSGPRSTSARATSSRS